MLAAVGAVESTVLKHEIVELNSVAAGGAGDLVGAVIIVVVIAVTMAVAPFAVIFTEDLVLYIGKILVYGRAEFDDIVDVGVDGVYGLANLLDDIVKCKKDLALLGGIVNGEASIRPLR